MFHYLVKEDEFLPAKQVDESGIEALDSGKRREILELASGQKITVNDIEEELDLERQAAYYHLRKLVESGLLEASSGRPKVFELERAAYYYRPGFVEPEENPVILGEVPEILRGFVEERRIEARIVVGAPYPHGEHDRRHRTSYKAGELSCLLGNYGRKREQLIYTDTELEKNPGLEDRPLISLAGPLVNTFSRRLNAEMDIGFNPSRDRIVTPDGRYSGEEVGFVTRKEVNGKPRMLAAGLYGIGTSAAIEALSSRASELGSRGAVVRGFGTKHSIEEVQIVEKL